MPSPASMVKLMKALGLKTDDLIRASDPQAVEAINAKLSRKGGKPTEQDVFQEIARLNAAMPVQQGGLGMGVRNTAQERARGLGFDTPAYHGSGSADIRVIDDSKRGTTTRQSGGEVGFFSTQKPMLADHYAELGAKGGWHGRGEKGNPVVYPLMLKTDSPKQYETATSFYREMDKTPDLEKFRGDLISSGYDSVFVRPDKEEIISLVPNKIRSRFAAFDPARVNENNLLASRLLPFALPGLLALPTDEE